MFSSSVGVVGRVKKGLTPFCSIQDVAYLFPKPENVENAIGRRIVGRLY